MTNKEELKNKFRKITETKWQRGVVIERMLSNDDLDTVFDFFWNEIEKIRKADMERVKQAFIQRFLGTGELWVPYEFDDDKEKQDAVEDIEELWGEVLSIIKQADEN